MGSDQQATWTGDYDTDLAGYWVANIGNVDGDTDGCEELLIGAPQAYYGEYTEDEGRVALVYGGSALPSGNLTFADADAIFVGTSAGDGLGRSVGGLGDFDSDGYADFALGAYAGSEFGSGIVYLYSGGPSQLSGTYDVEDADAARYGTAGIYIGNDSFIRSGELSGDGIDDAVFPAPYTSSYSGIVYVEFMVGWSLAIGDLDGDSREDLLVGAMGDDTRAVDGGAAFVFYGPLTTGFTKDGDDADATFYGLEGERLGDIVLKGDFDGHTPEETWRDDVVLVADADAFVFFGSGM